MRSLLSGAGRQRTTTSRQAAVAVQPRVRAPRRGGWQATIDTPLRTCSLRPGPGLADHAQGPLCQLGSSTCAGAAATAIVLDTRNRILGTITWQVRSHSAGRAQGGSSGSARGPKSVSAQRGKGGASPRDARIDPEALQYWQQAMDKVTRPALRILVDSLDWGHPLGLRKARATARGRVSNYDALLSAKQRYPTAMVLMRVGDAYMAVGFDALLLAQFCRVNLTSPESGAAVGSFRAVPSALLRHLATLVKADFSVAMVEETGVKLTSKSGLNARKERDVVAVVSPAQPFYLFGDVEDEYGGDDTPTPRPIAAVSIPSGGGYRLLRYYPGSPGILVQSQLSGEALLSELHATSVAPPLHLHAGVGLRDKADRRPSRTKSQLAAVLGVSVEEYGTEGEAAAVHGGPGGADVLGFKKVLGRMLGMTPQEAQKLQVLSPSFEGSAPVPPSLSTATQLGLTGTCPVPSLLDAAVTDSCPPPAREWLRRLLLLPPPPTAAEAIRAACGALAGRGDAALVLPKLVTRLSGARIAAMLAGQAAGHNTLREMSVLLERCAELLRLPGPAAQLLLTSLMRVLHWSLPLHAAWDKMPPEALAAACEAAADTIADVLPEIAAAPAAASAKADAGGDGAPRVSTDLRPPGGWLPIAFAPKMDPRRVTSLHRETLLAMARLVRHRERWRLAVREECVPEAAAKVTEKRSFLMAALLEVVDAAEKHAGCTVKMVFSKRDSAVWARMVDARGRKLVSKAQVDAVTRIKSQSGLVLVHPLNRKGLQEADRYSTEALEAATAEYLEAVREADKQTRQRIRELCRQLHGAFNSGPTAAAGSAATASAAAPPSVLPALPTLLAAAELSVIATALDAHVTQTKRNGWNWPLMPPSRPAAAAGEPVRDVELNLPGLWPYWKDRRHAVPNTVALRAGRVALLTGPNMAGKSTVLRSIAAAALLSICGLSVPATPGSAPHLPPGEPAPSAAQLEGLAPLPAPAPEAEAGAPSSPPAPVPLSCTWIQHISLRNFSGDSPLERKSAFAVEMEDTASTLSVAASCGRSSLVLLDELGKGTELLTGSALTAGVLNDLVRCGTAGVLATHLHDLVWLAAPHVQAGRAEYWAMEVREPERQRWQQEAADDETAPIVRPLRPTRRVLTGRACTMSLGLQVAEDCGMPPRLMRFAAAYERRVSDLVRRAREVAYAPSGAAPGSSGGGGEGRAAAGAAAAVGSAAGQVRVVAAPAEAGSVEAVKQHGPAGQEAVAEVQAREQQREGQAQLASPRGDGDGGRDSALVEAAGDNTIAEASASTAEDKSAAPTLADAGDYLRGHVRAALAAAIGVPEQELGPEKGALHWVKPEWRPSISHAGEAVVYVLHWWDGTFYVGETEDMPARITQHRAAESRERRKAGRDIFRGSRRTTALQAVYCVVPREACGGKSGALDIESDLIGELQRAGFPMRSTHDSKRNVLHRPQLPDVLPGEP